MGSRGIHIYIKSQIPGITGKGTGIVMFKQSLMLIFILLACCGFLHATEVKFGERPFINIYEVPDDAMEKGKIRIKLNSDYSDYAARLQDDDGYIEQFGIESLDELNQQFNVVRIKKVFFSPANSKEFSPRHQKWGLHLWFELHYDVNEDIRNIIMSYRDIKDIVQWAEPEYKKTLLSVNPEAVNALTEEILRWTPNDARYGEQWHYNNTGQTGGTVDADIDLPEAWNIEKGHPDVIVSVQDGGIQVDHPDLYENLWNNSNEIDGNGIDDDENGYIDDVYGYNFVDNNATIVGHYHGTHVAGTIAAWSNNYYGVAGIAGGSGYGGVRLMSTQVFGESYSGGFELAPVYSADNGAAISQNSWGYTYVGAYDQAVLDAIDYFNVNGGGSVLDGGITIYAAGNNGSSGQWYPGCYSGTFAVAATTHNDTKAWYSNYDTWVDVSAPGGETNSVTSQGVLSTYTESSYNYLQGTSMACPHVSGVAALVISYAHRNGVTLTNTRLKNILRNTTDNHYAVNPSYTGKLGTGRINAYAALLAADPTLPICTITAPADNSVIDQNSIVTINVTATDSDGTISNVAFYIDDVLQFTDYTSPYSWIWDTTGYAAGTHTIKAIATDNTNKTDQNSINVILLAPADEGFETGNFSAYAWVNSSSIPWTVQSSEKFSGTYAAKSGAIGHNGLTELSLTLTVSANGNISFFNKVSSEATYDFMRFYIDGVQQDSWSGNVDWNLRSYPVTAGVRIFKWAYTKDGSEIAGSDCAWLDHITFPPHSVFYAPPQNLTASPSHQSVLLSWQAPASGSPTGYKIFKNSALLTTVATLSYMDYAVTNGTSYSYYLKAVYSGGESDATTSVAATPNAIAPTNLTAVAGNNVINLSWTAATGRGDDRTISNYRIYRNGSALTTTAGTTYQDTGVTNGTTYSYYVTTIYTDPAGESAASNTVNATPAGLTEVILGSGTASTGTQAASPINVYYQSLHGQAVYTAAELNALGVFGPINITELGFNITALPDKNMPNFVVRMKHTTATNVTSWIDSQDLVTVYSNASYRPTATGYNMYTLSTPFLWNGTENLLIDTAYGLIGSYSSTGTVQYTSITNGYRYSRSDTIDQTNVFSGSGTQNTTSVYRPNVKLILQPIAVDEPYIAVTPNNIDFPETIVGSSDTRTITITNSGTAPLIGTITTPDRFIISQRSELPLSDRNVLPFEIAENTSANFSLVFSPSAAVSYSGSVVINSNAVNTSSVEIPVTGDGYIPPTITLNATELEVTLMPGQETNQNFTIGNIGSKDLRYVMGVQALRSRDRIKVATSTRNITGSTLTISADEYTPGSTVDWQFTVNCVSNDSEWLKSVIVTFPPGTVINSATEFVGGSSGNMIPDLTSGNGVTITWLGLSGNWGVVHPGETAIATVNVTMPESYSYPISLPYQILGDVYGAEPHILEGDFTLDPNVEPLDWFSVQPYSGILEGNEEQLIVGSFSALNLTPGSYQANLVIYANDAESPISQIDVALNVGYPIVITSPTGEEAWLSGTEQEILWNYSGTGTTVDLDYSIDGGENWLAIGTVAAATGANSYAWTIPYSPSAVCLIRITDSVEPYYETISNGFSIITPGISVDPLTLEYGTILINTSADDSFLITNPGTATLSGNITTPYGFNVELTRGNAASKSLPSRNVLPYSIAAGESEIFTVTFTAAELAVYDANLIITHNAEGEEVSISLTGQGGKPEIGISENLFHAELVPGQTDEQELTISNLGNMVLDYRLDIAEAPAWLKIEGGSEYVGFILVSATDDVLSLSFDATGLAPGNYDAVITGLSNDPDIPTFEIEVNLEVLVPLAITTPGGGEAWLSNSAQEILWNYSGTGTTVDLDYSIDGGANWLTIGTVATAAGANSHAWTIPYSPSTECLIRITDSVEPYYEAISNSFSIITPGISVDPLTIEFGTILINTSAEDSFQITNPGTATLIGNITAPNGFTVELSRGNTFNRDLSRWSGQPFIIAAGESETFTVTFTPTEFAVYDADLIITHNADADDITISLTGQGGQPELWYNENMFYTELAPGGTDEQFLTIVNNGNMDLEYALDITDAPAWLYLEGGSYYAGSILAFAAEDVLSLSFDASGLTPGRYDALLAGTSNDPDNPTFEIAVSMEVLIPLEITTPDGGEAWLSDSEQDILWNYTGTGATVDLDYSIDGGVNWVAIGTVATATGANSYAWTIPYTPSVNCQIRITDSVEPFYRAYSGIFSIILPEPPTTPLNLTISYDDATGELVLTWDAATGNPDSYMIYCGDTPDFTARPETLAATVPATQTSYRISAATTPAKAFYRVSAVRNP